MTAAKPFIHLLASLTLALAIHQPTEAAGIILTDTDFTNWGAFHLKFDDPLTAGSGPNNASGTGQRVATGGNPGAFLQLSHTLTTGDVSIIGAIKNDITFNPATDDPFPFLSLDFDVRTNSGGGGSGYQLVIKQNNIMYYSTATGFGLTTGWTRPTSAPLLLSSFDTNPLAGIYAVAPDGNRPDFSPTGAPLQFGVAISTRIIGGTSTATLRLDMDNLTVAPEPASTMFIFAGGLLLFARRNRLPK